jgi:hypothetical protein
LHGVPEDYRPELVMVEVLGMLEGA